MESQSQRSEPLPQPESSTMIRNTENQATEKMVTTKSKTSKLVVFLLLLSLFIGVGAIAGGYYLYQQLQQKQTDLQSITAEVHAFKQAQIAQSLQADELSKQFDKQLDKLSEQQQSLKKSVSGLSQQTPNHWMAAEADFLVQMAGRKLWLEGDINTAISLLKSADSQIAAMRDPSLLPLRKALAKDISNVRAVKKTDISGAVFAIDELLEQIPTLPLNQADQKIKKDKQEKELTDSIFDWQSNLDKTWQALVNDFVKIRKRKTDIEPLLSPKQNWYLVENIKNKLLQAQLALYRNDGLNYRHSMELAGKWIFEYFDLENEKTTNTLENINELAKLRLQSVNVKKFTSLPLLKQLVTYGELKSHDVALPKEGTSL
ncbi:MAG: uroporphyrinogen-III C-methyltransferase [Parashewanella sp.]